MGNLEVAFLQSHSPHERALKRARSFYRKQLGESSCCGKLPHSQRQASPAVCDKGGLWQMFRDTFSLSHARLIDVCTKRSVPTSAGMMMVQSRVLGVPVVASRKLENFLTQDIHTWNVSWWLPTLEMCVGKRFLDFRSIHWRTLRSGSPQPEAANSSE